MEEVTDLRGKNYRISLTPVPLKGNEESRGLEEKSYLELDKVQ